ncbi:MAG: prepilin peptidase [Terriglobia bacterium]|nr:prepilin peptidase [Terriglobia bacterium]
MDPNTVFTAVAFIFGLVFGSFLNVCIYRMPRGLSVVAPRSACPSCKKPIAGYDNIPVVSWLVLRGRCRNCGARIAARYIGVELLTGILFAACFWEFGPSLAAVKYTTFSFLLLGLIFTDCENRLLPDLLTLPGFFIGLAFSLVVPLNGLFEFLYAGDFNWRALSLADALLAAFIGGGFIWAAGELYFRMRGMPGMGFGDVKLLLMIGAFLGVRLTVLTVFAASVGAAVIGIAMFPAVYRRRQKAVSLKRRFPDEKERRQEAYDSAMRCMRLPFGSFLGGAALFVTFFGERVANWYLGLYR